MATKAKKASLTPAQIRANYLESDIRLYRGVDSENEGKWAIFEGDPPSGAWVMLMYPGDRVDFDNLESKGLSPKEFEKIYKVATGKTLENSHEVEDDEEYPKKSSRETAKKPRPWTVKTPAVKDDAKDPAPKEDAKDPAVKDDAKDPAPKEDAEEDEDLKPPSDKQGS